MKRSHAIAAHAFRLSLKAGVVDHAEVIQWADDIMATEDYDDAIANISMSANAAIKDLEALLGTQFPVTEDEKWEAARWMLVRMHDALAAEPKRLHEFTRFLESLWIRSKYDVPKDLGFIIGLEDDYLLAEQGHFGSLEEVRSRFLQDLSTFRRTRTKAD